MKKTLILLAMSGTLAAPALASQYHLGQHEGPALHSASIPIGYPGAPVLIDRTIKISMADAPDGAMSFDVGFIDIRRGETIRLVLTNDGAQPHDFVMASPEEIADHREAMRGAGEMIHEAGYAAQVAPGAVRTLVWTFANEGEFAFACLIPGHYEAGMNGRLTVE
ncbi:plastocyanin/azurin family copper-binding protein [Jannaschia sp. M317]|uniref:cupredoxin domain-containing protein n=1 Tax=Jannaschia sp. M317 TaxID=2867011 RepID=UPI0021A2F0DE|nr:plastocyanin/azurin family copper-binding protein [Jannaschia sp. M317]UWQ19741.1 copper oxidase [Jannaschia sp. M317]